jgi:hypothetical protein
MTINLAIAKYGEAAQAGIRISVVSNDEELTVRFCAKPASLEFLDHVQGSRERLYLRTAKKLRME